MSLGPPDGVSQLIKFGTNRYVEGGSLANASRSFGKFSEHLVACYAAKMLEGLHYLHGQDVGTIVQETMRLTDDPSYRWSTAI